MSDNEATAASAADLRVSEVPIGDLALVAGALYQASRPDRMVIVYITDDDNERLCAIISKKVAAQVVEWWRANSPEPVHGGPMNPPRGPRPAPRQLSDGIVD
jgi:hypothetical protein